MKKWHASFFMALLLTIALILGACSSEALQEGEKAPLKSSQVSSELKAQTGESADVHIGETLIPSADGTITYKADCGVIDASNTSCGYIMVNYAGTNSKVKLQITGPDANTYTYNLHGGYEVFPLTAGSGNYTVGIYENIEGTQYALVLSKDIQADIKDALDPYLYPNQYVWFTADSKAVLKASELVNGKTKEEEIIESIYNYVIENVAYDYDKAANVSSGYLPDVDKILEMKKGICFDYAALMGAMLRSQGIPTRMEVGYNGGQYHAWISVYIKHKGWINGVIELKDNTWRLMDPTFAASSKSPKEFITQDKDYIVKYVY